jgi:PAS domain S-box-containing protein
MKILVVDNDEYSRTLLTEQLSSYDYEVSSAVDGADALEQALTLVPDMIISDITMPGMDGYQLCRECKQNEKLKNTPFIFYTATCTPDEDKNFTLSLGADKFIIKPVEADILIQMLSEVVEKANSGSFLQLFNHMSSGVAVYEALNDGEDFIFREFNKAAEKIENISRQEVINKKVTKVFPGVTSFGLFEVFQRVWRTGVPESHPVSEYKDERITGWRENYVYKLPTGEIVSIYDNITEQKKAENKLKESEERYRLLVENSEDAVLLTSPQGGIESANPAACHMFGRSEQEICESGRNGIVDITDPRLGPLLEERERTGKARGILTLIRKDGTRFSGEVTSVIFNDKEGKAKTSMIIRDISEREKAEEELLLRAQLLDNASDGICLFNQDGNLVYANEMFYRTRGYCKEELIGVNIRQMDENVTEEWSKWLEEELKQKGLVVFESTHYSKDGSVLNFEVHSSEIRVGDKKYNLSVERDITERKQSEEYLRESELFNSSLLENSPNPIVVINADTSIRYINPAMVRLTGYSFEELIAIKPPYPYWKKEETEGAAARLKEDMIHGVKNHEVEFNRKNGEKFWVSISNTPIKSGDKLEYLLSTWVDITESKKATEALKESEEKYKSLVQNTLTGVYIEIKSHFVYVNPEFQKLTGYSEEELLKMKADDVVHPDDIFLVRKAAVDMLKNQRNTPYEFRIITANGMTRWAMEIVTSIVYMGKKASLGSIMDITERKGMETALRESEEKFSEIFYASPKPMTIIAPDTGIINDVNKAFLNSSGFMREECLGRTITELDLWVSEEERYKFLKILSEQENVQNFETEMRIKSGEIRNILLSTTTITITDKPYVIISSDDITEQKRMQENLIVTDRLASVGELAAGIAHELNNPLTGVIGFSDLLMARNDLPQDAREDLDIVNREALRASQVARHLLTFARKHPDEKKQININDVILLVLELRAYEQRVNNIEVITSLDENLPYVLANDFQLQQVFINIIINAEHFMIETNRRGRLEITTEKRGNSIITTIADDGPGIAPEHLNRIFDPFFTMKDVGKGTGLGLSICYGIITEHGGTIHAESGYGKGASFIIELPVIFKEICEF